jgi:hypothetical protein
MSRESKSGAVLGVHPIFCKRLKESAPTNQIEGFSQVFEGDAQWYLLLSTLLLQLA